MAQVHNNSDDGGDKSSEKSQTRLETRAENKERSESAKDLNTGSLNDMTRATRLEQYKSGSCGITGQGDQQGRFRSSKEIFGDAAHTPLTKEAEDKRNAEFEKRGWDANELQGKKPDHANFQEAHQNGSVLLKVNEPLADTRNTSEKIQDFLQAATKRATDPVGWKAWAQGEMTKFSGIGAGLNEAKDETKAAVVTGFKAMTDGTVAEFLSNPNAINAPIFKTVENVFDAMGKDPEAVNKAFEGLGKVVLKASEQYSNLSDYDKGKAIGNAMFFMINPEGSLEAPQTVMKATENTAQAAAKVVDTVATHVDTAVMDTVSQSIKAIEQGAKSAPEVAEKTKQMLYDYLKSKGLTGPEFEYAGVPKDYFDGMQKPQGPGKDDAFLAMSKADDGLENPSGKVEKIHEPEHISISERFVKQIEQEVKQLTQGERDFLKGHSIEIKPVRRLVGENERLGACYSPEDNAIYVPEQILKMGKWVDNDDVPHRLRHEFGHLFNARANPLQEGYLSDEPAFREAYKNDLTKISPETLKDLQLSSRGPVNARDEVFADMYGHVSGLRASAEATSAYSLKLKESFPNCLKYLEDL